MKPREDNNKSPRLSICWFIYESWGFKFIFLLDRNYYQYNSDPKIFKSLKYSILEKEYLNTIAIINSYKQSKIQPSIIKYYKFMCVIHVPFI